MSDSSAAGRSGPVTAGTGRTRPVLRSADEIAAELGVSVRRVRQLLRDRTVIGLQQHGTVRIPVDFISDGSVLRGLAGTITLLTDAGLTDEEIIRWLFTPERPGADDAVRQLHEGRRREVHRRAQIAGF